MGAAMLIIVCLIIFGFCLVGPKFIGRLVCVIALAALLLVLLVKASGIFPFF
jgi:hypothetical protein